MGTVQTKILATPEAYQLLASPTDGGKIQSAIREAVLAATHKRESPLTDYYIINCPVSVHGRLTESPDGDVFTVLLYSKNGKGAMFFLFDEHYEAAVESAVPVEMV
jgi:hypothetical protein